MVNKTIYSRLSLSLEMTYLYKVGSVTIVINAARVKARPSTFSAQTRD
jgi:hypothetical protein